MILIDKNTVLQHSLWEKRRVTPLYFVTHAYSCTILSKPVVKCVAFLYSFVNNNGKLCPIFAIFGHFEEKSLSKNCSIKCIRSVHSQY